MTFFLKFALVHDLSFFYTAGGLKSDRNGFTKMRVTALIIVRLL